MALAGLNSGEFSTPPSSSAGAAFVRHQRANESIFLYAFDL
jgi:hypothetical protein